MAVTKIWKVVKRMDHVIGYAKDVNKTKIEFNQNYEMLVDDLQNVIDYARNSDKTEKEYFVTGINCDSDSAYEEMQDTKRYYNKKDKILAFHAYQSFAEGEVTPELAHQIGVQLANEMWGDRFQVVVTTHLNTNHIHNHIVLNSVSFEDGLKYYDNHTNYAKMRHISDELCKEYGLSVIEEKETKKKMNYDNFYKKSLYTDNYSNNAKRDLDLAIRQAYSYDDFLYLMKKLDYEIIFRANKISIRKEPYKRNIRIERRYGENYSIENIKRRIIEEQAVRVPFIENVYNYRKVNYPFAKRHKRAKAKGFIALYYHYCYLLKVFPDNVPQQRLPPSIRADVSRMEQLSEEARFLATHKIKTFEELSNYQDDVNFKIKEILDQRERLWAKRKLSKDGNEMHEYAEQISSLNDKLVKLRKRVELCEDIKTRVPKIDNNLSELERSLSHLLIEEKGKPSSKYLKRINDTFPFRDGKNCQRVYEAITDLNEKDSSSLNLNMLIEDAISVQNSKNYLGIEKKYETLFQYINQSDYSHLQQTYMNALLKQNKLVKLKLYILNNHIEKKEFWLNLVDLQIGDTCKAVIYFTEHLPENQIYA